MIRIDSIVHIAFLILDLNSPGYFICSDFIICRHFIGKLFFKKNCMNILSPLSYILFSSSVTQPTINRKISPYHPVLLRVSFH